MGVDVLVTHVVGFVVPEEVLPDIDFEGNDY